MGDTQWVLEEFSDVDLGDQRRSKRLLNMVDRFRKNPEASLPQFLKTEAELEGAYRLLSNPAVRAEEILHPHIKRSSARAENCDVALVIHDTTDISFDCYGDVARKNVTRTASSSQGFRLHSSLAVSADGTRLPLGTLASRAFVHKIDIKDDEVRRWWKERDGILNNEQDRWLQGVIEAEENAPDAQLIHVCDREGDAYEFLGSMVELQHRFVVRAGNKRLIIDENGQEIRMHKALEQQDFIEKSTRTLTMQARYGAPAIGTKSIDPKKKPKSRTADVSFRAIKATIRKPKNHKGLSYIEAPTTLNIVEVLERHPPKDQTPVRWVLATSEPVSTPEDVLKIVDYYCDRWMIEEYHKVLKTGCAYEKRQLASAHALLNTLSITIPVAIHMLMLRHFAHTSATSSAHTLFSKEELLVMRALTSEEMVPSDPTIQQALNVLAQVGGHIKANGSPGWQVLYRGYIEFIHARKGFIAAFRMMGTAMPEM